MVAQIDEQHAAMVADAVAPSRTAARLADVGCRAARRRYGYDNGAWMTFRSRKSLIRRAERRMGSRFVKDGQ